MKVEMQNAGACRARVIVNAAVEESRPLYDDVVAAYRQAAKIPGFRPGHATLPVVLRAYRDAIDGDVRKRVIGTLYPKAIAEAKISPVALVDVTDFLFSPETGASFVLVVDVAPDFKLPKYQGIPLKGAEVAVGDEEVERQIAMLRENLSRFEEQAVPAGAGDRLCIDYTATCDGKPLAEAIGECGSMAAGQDAWVRAATPEFLPGVELDFVGLRAGDSRDVAVKFGKEHPVENTRGHKASYHVQVKRVHVAFPPTDEELLARLQVADMDALTLQLRKRLEASANQREQARLRHEVADFLVKRCDFELPQSQVAEEAQMTLQRMLAESGITQRENARELLEQHRDEILGAASATAQTQVRLRYILSRIADAETIEASDEEVDAQVTAIARTRNLSVQELRDKIEERNGLAALRTDIRCEKVLTYLIGVAKIK